MYPGYILAKTRFSTSRNPESGEIDEAKTN